MFRFLLACTETLPAAEVVPPVLNRPDILVVVADDLGLDATRTYGIHPLAPPTPAITGLAERGVRFDRTWATPACSPARAQILTGRFGRRYGLGNIVSLAEDAAPYDLPESEQTLGELAQDAGYTSIYIGKWHLTGYADSWIDAPLRHGFDRFRTTAGNLWTSVDGDPTDYYRFERNDNGAVALHDGYLTTVQTDDAIAEAQALDEPWLMVVAYNAVHEPFDLPPPELFTIPGLTPTSPVQARYRAMVQALDAELQRLIDAVVDEDTYVIFVSDNGTPYQVLLPPTPQFQGKPSISEGGLQVPLLVSGPGIESGHSDALVQLVDLLPTVAGWLGQAPEQTLDGFDLAPQLAEPSTPSARALQYAESFYVNGHPELDVGQAWAVRDERYKFVQTELEHFYDLAETRWDVSDQIGEEDPARVETYRAAAAAIQASLVAP